MILGATLLGSAFTVPATVFLALATSITSDGNSMTEVTTNIGYTRQYVQFSGIVSTPDNSCINSQAVTWSAASSAWGTVAHVAICDTLTIGQGNVLYHTALDSSKTVSTSDVVSFAYNALSVKVD